MGNLGPVQIIIIVLIVAVLFGGKRLRNLGGDLGASIKGFKKSIKDEPKNIEDNSETSEPTAAMKEKEEEKS